MTKTYLAIALFLGGCASLNSLPQSASEVDFNPQLEGRTGWSKYEEVFFFRGVDKRTCYMATKAGLADAEFTIKKANYEKSFVLGEHGITAYDWNIVAGVYIKSDIDGCTAKAIVEGSKDVGFWGDMTASSWAQDIFKGMRQYILTESQINDPNKKHFQ
tara:strand:+ start:114 stop:590 length:477 start_codon:yes stop_codon:yes gene_type:complete